VRIVLVLLGIGAAVIAALMAIMGSRSSRVIVASPEGALLQPNVDTELRTSDLKLERRPGAEVIHVPKGTKATVVGRAESSRGMHLRIRIREGPRRGAVGWVQADAVQFEVAWP
jgi:hypothetical protein